MMISKSIWMLILAFVFWASGGMNSEANLPAAGSGLHESVQSIEEQADLIKASLENDPLTQTDMNLKSQELVDLWDQTLNDVLSELKASLPEEEWTLLQEEQRIWAETRERLSAEAGKGFEGGSVYPLIVNMEAARLTEERISELLNLLKES